jgi:enoyl-CoA hydratase/carnithine racemase
VQRLARAVWNTEVPTIAAVNGWAVGLGCDLACMCDIRIAADSARFAESFLKVGLIPGDGGAWFLPRVVGFSKAAEMTFTGDALDAQQALACGLVSSIVPGERLLQEAQALAARIAANPPQALRLAKRLLRESQHARLDDVLELSAAFQALVQESEDHDEAVAAALEKRPPTFHGR